MNINTWSIAPDIIMEDLDDAVIAHKPGETTVQHLSGDSLTIFLCLPAAATEIAEKVGLDTELVEAHLDQLQQHGLVNGPTTNFSPNRRAALVGAGAAALGIWTMTLPTPAEASSTDPTTPPATTTPTTPEKTIWYRTSGGAGQPWFYNPDPLWAEQYLATAERITQNGTTYIETPTVAHESVVKRFWLDREEDATGSITPLSLAWTDYFLGPNGWTIAPNSTPYEFSEDQIPTLLAQGIIVTKADLPSGSILSWSTDSSGGAPGTYSGIAYPPYIKLNGKTYIDINYVAIDKTGV